MAFVCKDSESCAIVTDLLHSW